MSVSMYPGETAFTRTFRDASSRATDLVRPMSPALVARELASRNVRVNAVSPGYIDTDMTASLPDSAKQKMAEMIPLGRLGRVEDVAAAVAWLCSDQASYVTGEVLRVNGGMHM